MKILAIDTTEAACSAALFLQGELSERFEIAPRRHSELILPMMDGLLAEAGLRLQDLDALAFARGPGSFTGVRIAAAVAQGAATAAELPVVPVSGLLALAQGQWRAHGAQQVLAAFDARMNEVYWAACQAGDKGMQLLGEETVCAPQAVPLPEQGQWQACGSGWLAYASELQDRLQGRLLGVDAEAMIHAADVAVLAAAALRDGQAVAPEQALPVYLRDQVAKKMAAS